MENVKPLAELLYKDREATADTARRGLVVEFVIRNLLIRDVPTLIVVDEEDKFRNTLTSPERTREMSLSINMIPGIGLMDVSKFGLKPIAVSQLPQSQRAIWESEIPNASGVRIFI